MYLSYIFIHCMMDWIYIHVKHIKISCRITSIIENALSSWKCICVLVYISVQAHRFLFSLECKTFSDYLTGPLTGWNAMWNVLTSLKKRCRAIFSISLSLFHTSDKLFCNSSTSILHFNGSNTRGYCEDIKNFMVFSFKQKESIFATKQ